MNPLERAAARSQWAKHHVGEKALLLLGLVVVCIAVPTGLVSLAIALTLAWVVVAAKVPPKLLAVLVAAPAVFIVVSVVPLIVAISPQGLVWVPDGPHTALALIIRSLLATTATIIFSLTTPFAEMLQWLRNIGVPAYLVHVVSLTYLMTATLLSTAKTMWDAQAMRLGHSNKRRWMRSLGEQAATLFVLSFERARRLQEGLALRAEPGSMEVLVNHKHLRPPVVVATCAWLAALVLIGWKGWPL